MKESYAKYLPLGIGLCYLGSHGGLSGVLLSKIAKTYSQGKILRITLLHPCHICLTLLHQGLQNGGRDLAIARTNSNETTGQSSNSNNFHVAPGVREHWQEQLDHILAVSPCVRKPKPKDGAESHDVAAVEDVVGQQGQGRIAFVPHTSVDDPTCKQSTRLDPVLRAVKVLVNLGQTTINIPKQHKPDAGSSGEHAVLLVLVQPLVPVFHQQLVLSEASVDEPVDKAAGKVLPCTVHSTSAKGRPHIVKVSLVHIIWCFGLHDVKLTGKERKWLFRWLFDMISVRSS